MWQWVAVASVAAISVAAISVAAISVAAISVNAVDAVREAPVAVVRNCHNQNINSIVHL
jgi:hypothetical protein